MKDTQNPEELLPLSPIQYHILIALVDRELHGYAIRQQVQHDTEGTVTISVGTMYGAIKRMLKNKLIEESDRQPEPDEDRRRVYYQLTPFGQRVLAAENRIRDRALQVARGRPAFGTSFSPADLLVPRQNNSGM